MPNNNHHNIHPAEEGKRFRYMGSYFTVQPKCDMNRGSWVCISCRKPFDNQMQKDTHIGTGVHTLAWFCHEHNRFEVP